MGAINAHQHPRVVTPPPPSSVHKGSGVRLEETITLECENYDIIEVDLQTWQGRHCGGGPGHTRSTVKLTLAPGDERMLVLQPDENMIGRSMSYRQSTSFGLQPI